VDAILIVHFTLDEFSMDGAGFCDELGHSLTIRQVGIPHRDVAKCEAQVFEQRLRVSTENRRVWSRIPHFHGFRIADP
jgi:hypothetical protein